MFAILRCVSACAIIAVVMVAWPTQFLSGQGAAISRQGDTLVNPYVLILGIAQDGGYPQAGCTKPCCQRVLRDASLARNVVCLAIIDPATQGRWLVECTPDFRQQLHALNQAAPPSEGLGISGIFVTHAHVGHYAGLINLGREILGAKQIPTYVMPRMEEFLRSNGPWKLLVELKNIELKKMNADESVVLNPRISITPITVPHRDEFSETVAFRIAGPNRTILFLPDIDKWDRWERMIEDEISRIDIAFLDATFFDSAELPGRNMREIPHPFAVESLERFSRLSSDERAKIRLIHFNHSNPLLDPESSATRQVRSAGIGLAVQGEKIEL